jgi:hypothetical protein
VFVCDASGSMMDKIDLLKIELHKTIESLKPLQSFDVMREHDAACSRPCAGWYDKTA